MEAVEKIVIRLYSDNRSAYTSFLDLRLNLFQKTVAKSKKGIQLNALPPTESLIQHTIRVYLQIQS